MHDCIHLPEIGSIFHKLQSHKYNRAILTSEYGQEMPQSQTTDQPIRHCCEDAQNADSHTTVKAQFQKRPTHERSQNAGKVTHIKGRLPDQALILFNCVPFQNGNFSLRKEFATRGSEFFP